MAIDVTTLSVKVESKGIDAATASLDALGAQAERTEKAVGKLTEKMANSSASIAAIKASMDQMKGVMQKSFPTDGAVALNKALSELSATLKTIKGKNINVDITGVGREAEVATKGVASLNRSLMEGHNVFQVVGKSLYSLRNLLGGTMLAGAMIEMSQSAIKMADSWALMGARLRLYSANAAEAVVMQDKLFQVAQDLRIPLASVTTLYTRLVPALQEYGLSSKEALQVTQSMGAALKVSGATGAETASVMLQFSQAMAAGRLNGAEFNAVAEGAPIILRMLSKELGVSRGELKKMAAEGMLTSDIITNILTAYREELEKQAKTIPDTVESAIGNLSSAMTRYFGKLNEATGVTSGLASIIKGLANNIDAIGKVIEFFAISTLAMLIARLTAAGVSMGVVALAASGLAKEMGIAAASTGVLSTALNFLAKHPVIIGFTALATAGYYAYQAFKDTTKSAEDLNLELEKAKGIENEKERFEALSERVKTTGQEYENASKHLKDLQATQQRQTAAQNAMDWFGLTDDMPTKIEKAKEEVKKMEKAWLAAKDAAASHNEEVDRLSRQNPNQALLDKLEILDAEYSAGKKFTETQRAIYNLEKQISKTSLAVAEGRVRAGKANLETMHAQLGILKQIDAAETRNADRFKATKSSAKETESFAKKYEKLIESSKLFIVKQKEELSLKRKLTDAEKEALKIEEFIKNNRSALSAGMVKSLTLIKETIAANGEQIRTRKLLNQFLDEAQEKRLKDIDLQQQEARATFSSLEAINEKIKLQRLANAEMEQTPLGAHLDQLEADKRRIKFLQQQIVLIAEELDLKIQLAWWSALENGDEEALQRAEKAGKNLQDRIDGYEKEIKVIQKSIDANGKLTDVLDKAAKIKMFDIGRTPGQILADGFGEAGAAIGKMIDAYTSFGKEAAQVNKYVADKQKLLMENGMGSSEARIKAEEDVADKRIQINSAMFASMAGAAKGFFTENSKGYQFLAKAEKAFRVVELAMAAKNFVAKMTMTTTETAAVVAGEGTKLAVKETSTLASIALSMQAAAANAVEAVTGAFVGVGPTGFVTGAAMLAVMAGLGFALSGGGGSSSQSSGERQASQGTGSVFGDTAAKSESVTKALENLSENSDISLKYNEGMLNALRNIESALGGVTKLVVRSGVQGKLGFAEGMGTSHSSTINKMFNLGDAGVISSIIFAPIKAIGNALFSVKKSVVDSGFIQNAQTFADILSGGLDVKGYQDIETKKKRVGKTKTSTETNLSALDEELQTQLSNLVLGMGDSVKEAAKILKMDGEGFTNTLNSFVVDLGRISIQGMDAKQIQETLTNVFSKMGDDMAKAVLPGLDKFQEVGEGYLETLIRVSSTVATVEGIFDSIGQTMNVTGMAGIEAKMKLVELAGGLSELSSKVQSFYDNFYNEQEKTANKTRLVTEEFKRLGIQMIDLNAEDARIKFRDIVNYYKDTDVAVYNSLLNIQDAVNDLVPAFDEASEAVETLAQKLEKLHSAANDSLSALEKSIKAEKTALKKTLDDKVSALKDQKEAEDKSYAASKSALEDQLAAQTSAYDAQISMYNSQVDAAKDASSAMKSLFADIESAIQTLTGTQSQLTSQAYSAAKAQLDTALMLAKATGILPNPETFKATLDAVSNVDASKFSSLFDFQREQLQTAGKLSQLNSVVGGKITQQDATIVAIEASIVAIESVKVSAENAAQVALADLEKKHKETIAKIDEQITALEDQYEADVFYLDGLLENAREQLAKAEGTWQATKSVHDALVDFNTNLMAYIDAKTSSADQIVAMDVKTASLSEQANTSDSDAAAELKLLREELAAQNRAIAQNTLATAKILSNWDGDGQPETRVVA